jgi:hypothetical protein
MRKKNGFLWVLLSVFALAIIAGGCGGGGGEIAPEPVRFVSLETPGGRWRLYDWEGTVVVDGQSYQLGLDGGYAEFEMVTSGDDEAVFDVLVNMDLEEVYEGSSHLDSLSANTGKERGTVTRMAHNKFMYTAGYGTIKITFISDTSASVEMNVKMSVEASEVETRKADVKMTCEMTKEYPVF